MACALAFGVTSAGAHDGASSTDGAIDHAKITHGHQHGATDGHLSPVQENVELVSKLTLKNAVPEKIADVGVHKGYAYLAAWGVQNCVYNGVHVVDVRNPTTPKEVAFIQAKEGSYPGEGIQALSIDTPSFTGDILVSNNEICPDKGVGFGGMNIYDVTNPAHPRPLAEGVGDETVPGQGKKAANEIHSVFAWDAGDKAYAVIVDNEEGADVDILDISNPKMAKVVAEYDLDEMFPHILQPSVANLVEVFDHDVIVKQIGTKQVMSVSYWDGGYVLLDVTDPTRATYIADSDFPNPDPEILAATGQRRLPEGNAHQSEFTRDNKYLIGADEDFSPNFSEGETDDETPFSNAFFLSQGTSTNPVGDGATLTGGTFYVGRACIGDPMIPPAPTLTIGNQIAVVVRGLCTFTEKIANVVAARGYEGVVVVNREGSDGCGAFGMSVTGSIPSFSLSRSLGYDLFDVRDFGLTACLAGAASLLPGVALPAANGGVPVQGDKLTIRAFFDGWGYVRLFKAPTLRPAEGKVALTQLDSFAIPEAVNPAYSSGFGDLSVHEVATSQIRDNLAYFSYYSAGLRVMKINATRKGTTLDQVGQYVAPGGSNYWGVEVFQNGGQEYVAASDRDHGLWIFRYTGP